MKRKVQSRKSRPSASFRNFNFMSCHKIFFKRRRGGGRIGNFDSPLERVVYIRDLSADWLLRLQSLNIFTVLKLEKNEQLFLCYFLSHGADVIEESTNAHVLGRNWWSNSLEIAVYLYFSCPFLWKTTIPFSSCKSILGSFGLSAGVFGSFKMIDEHLSVCSFSPPSHSRFFFFMSQIQRNNRACRSAETD